MSLKPKKSDPSFQLVGRFLFHWNAIEFRITGILKEILSIPEPQASIVFANVAFRDKTSMIATLAELALRPDAPADADEAKKLISDVVAFSSDYRNLVAHNAFVPLAEGGIQVFRVKAKRKYEAPLTIWDPQFFQDRFVEIKDLDKRLRRLRRSLKRHAAQSRLATELRPPNTNKLLQAIRHSQYHPPRAGMGFPPPKPNRGPDAQTPEGQEG